MLYLDSIVWTGALIQWWLIPAPLTDNTGRAHQTHPASCRQDTKEQTPDANHIGLRVREQGSRGTRCRMQKWFRSLRRAVAHNS